MENRPTSQSLQIKCDSQLNGLRMHKADSSCTNLHQWEALIISRKMALSLRKFDLETDAVIRFCADASNICCHSLSTRDPLAQISFRIIRNKSFETFVAFWQQFLCQQRLHLPVSTSKTTYETAFPEFPQRSYLCPCERLHLTARTFLGTEKCEATHSRKWLARLLCLTHTWQRHARTTLSVTPKMSTCKNFCKYLFFNARLEKFSAGACVLPAQFIIVF